MERRIKDGSEGRATAANCDFCSMRKGRNWMILHQLKFRTGQELRTHLVLVLPKSDLDSGFIDAQVGWYYFLVRYYGQKAKDLDQPVWLTYMERLGTKVRNRERAIMKHRENRPAAGLPF